MTALPQQLDSIAPDRLDWSTLIDVAEAARLLGLSASQVRREAAEKLAPRALAFYVSPPRGGRPQWWIDRRSDPKLSRGAAVELDGGGDALQRVNARKRAKALAIAECVRAFSEAKARASRSGLTLDDWLPQLVGRLREQFPQLKISRTSLYRWHKQARTNRDVTTFIDGRGGNQRSLGDPAAWDHFERLYLRDSQPSLKDCWRRTKIHAERHGLTWCAESTCRQHLNTRIPPERQTFHRQPKLWRQQMQPGIEQDVEAWAAGECWVGDHTQLDLWCRFGKSIIRPWLTAWQDWRTRRIVGWTLSTNPNSSTVLSSFRAGVLDEKNTGGPPKCVWIDNGKDYDAWLFHGQTKTQRLREKHVAKGYINEGEFRGLFSHLHIEVHFSLAYNPNGKARMERWFKTCHGQFDKSFASYAGRSIDTKPESLKKLLANPALLPDFAEVERQLAEYIAAFNASSDHAVADLVDDTSGGGGGRRFSPNQAMAAWCESRRVYASDADLDLFLQKWHKPVKCGRNGITIRPRGLPLRYGGMAPELSRYKAIKAKDRPELWVTYDPADVSSIRVYDTQFQFVCEAGLNDVGGLHDGSKVSEEKVAALIKRKREYRRALATVRDSAELEYLTAAEVLIQSQPDDAAPDQPASPGAMQVLQTPVDGQSKAVEQHQFRKAAGAESMGGGVSGGGVQDFAKPEPRERRGLPDVSGFLDDVTPGDLGLGDESDVDGPLAIDAFRDTLIDGGSPAQDELDDDDPLASFRSE